MTAELLNVCTERDKQEQLNNYDSFDRKIGQDDGSGMSLINLISDNKSAFENAVIDGLNREQEALAVRKVVAALPELERKVVELYYFFEGKCELTCRMQKRWKTLEKV